MTTIGIIPARGGSKRVPNKNILHCAGKPLIAYSCEAALNSKCIDRLIVSTDSEEIASVAKAYGAEVPFMRPAELSTDSAPTLPVLQHAIEYLETQGEKPKNIVLLQATSPLREARHIDGAFEIFLTENAESVVSVLPAYPSKTLRLSENGLEPFFPQQLWDESLGGTSQGFIRNGPSIVITKTDVIKKGSLYGEPNMPYIMTLETSVDIDTPFDFQVAEWLLQRRDGENS